MFSFVPTFKGFNQWLCGPYYRRPVASQELHGLENVVDPNYWLHDNLKAERKVDP